ncbi:class I SAM-dependent DNA methyltransferase [Enhygromyxa salina]|uniref:dTDP-3-amino-3,6-dideoxy-alpha-D-glucopyranose N,N-dimethyltransferase n=1 Tax=Enhygromyxa salina TaxID=215803 RepID=A0A2S9YSR8_9BACT|nr:class I SAM-dependent methyltransferase [Enhygromyxa salina]PRQ08089.1 dTDP-3-amino-3,6-dideoxy-alpha-D-glucopyranose N,N-dimethyltransferase [Enhygromyxa salina]
MTTLPPDLAEGTRATYERHAVAFDQHRHRVLTERKWLDRLLALCPPNLPLLDVGCGAGEPIARYLIDAGRVVVGVDFAESMLELCRARFPDQRWISGDMRQLELGELFGGVVAWDSFFHLTRNEQRTTLPRLARHTASGGVLLFTCGPHDGEVVGTVEGEPVYHSSLSPAEYASLLEREGFVIEAFVAEDPDCDSHTVCLARRR